MAIETGLTPTTIGWLVLAGMLLLIVIRVPIAISLATAGLTGLMLLQGWEQAFVQVQLITWEVGTNFLWITLPLFILMGNLAFKTGFAADLYDCVYKWFGRYPGGLAVTSTISSAGFGALTGSSVATVSAIGKMLLPEMKRYHYQEGLSAGSLASAGVLAILIPPSVPLVFYGVWTETSIGDLFIAAIIPAILLTLFFATYIFLRCRLNTDLGPTGPVFPLKDRIKSLRLLAPTVLLFGLVLVGIYGGFFSPTEAAAMGVIGVVLIALLKRSISIPGLREAFDQSALLSGNVLLILLGGMIFSRFWIQTDITPELIASIHQQQLSPMLIILCLVGLYIVLGAILDTFSMIITTLPVVFPLVTSLGYDPIWFGIFLVVMIEMSLITPPIGLNVIVMHRLTPNTDISTIFKGSIPFVGLCILLIVLLLIFPNLALWLPSTM